VGAYLQTSQNVLYRLSVAMAWPPLMIVRISFHFMGDVMFSHHANLL